MVSRFRAISALTVLAVLGLGGLSGCSQGNNSEVMAPPPEAKIAPQTPVKVEEPPKGGAPAHSSASFDSARGGASTK